MNYRMRAWGHVKNIRIMIGYNDIAGLGYGSLYPVVSAEIYVYFRNSCLNATPLYPGADSCRFI